MALPSGYKRLEYIQSSGTQYVDTLFKPNQDTRVVMDVKLLSQTTASVGIFAVRDTASPTAANKFCAWSMTTGASIRSDYFSTAANVTSSVSIVGTRLTIDKNKNVCFFGETTLTNTAATGKCTQNLYLLCTNDGGAAKYYATADLYSCQIYDNGTLIRDYIPCQKPDGTIGLWDDVNSVFYGNAGTGTFTAGPVVAHIPEAPSNLQQTMAVRLAWAAVSGAERYNVYRDGTLLATTTDLAYVDDTAAENTEYTYGVSAVNSAGESPKTTISVYTKTGYFLYKPVVESATFQ